MSTNADECRFHVDLVPGSVTTRNSTVFTMIVGGEGESDLGVKSIVFAATALADVTFGTGRPWHTSEN